MNNFILDFWENQAEIFKGSHCASWGDNYAIALETENIKKYINKKDKVLDAGCANGHATLSMLEKQPAKIYGIDISEKMIFYANENRSKLKDADKAEFRVGDIKQLEFENDFFDVVYTTRALI